MNAAIDAVTSTAEATGASEILILPSNCGVTITVSAEQVFSQIAPFHEIFRRGGVAMRLVELEQGKLTLDVVKPEAFRSLLEKFGKLMVWRVDEAGGRKLVPTLCPEQTATALLACEKIELLPPVRGIVASPVLANVNGTPQVFGKGYHPENGGLLVTGGTMPPDLPIDEAVTALRLLVDDFDFKTPGDRSRALASIITPGLCSGRWIADSVPADVAEADQSQSGKTYRQKIIFALYAEEPRRIAIKDGGVGGTDESVSQAMLSGSPFIQIDNVRGKFDSQFIEMTMTAGGMVGVRVPYKGEVQIDARHFHFFLTSNGVETTRDLSNRSSIIRIRKRPGFAFRAFPEGDLLAHVHALQPYFLGAVFAVIRAWGVAGCPRTNETRHDFRLWAGALDWIVQNILREAPLLDGHAEAQERVSNPALTWLRFVALAVGDEQRMGQELSASAIAEICAEHEIDLPGKHQDDDESRRKQIGVLMKRALGNDAVARVDGYKIERREVEKYSEAESRYRTVKTYVVSLETA
jgi:hypothetical protein